MKLALTLLFTYPGVPCVYYGNEVGMQGSPCPDCRRCLNWYRANWNVDLLAHVRALAGLRKSRTKWRAGACLARGAGENWVAYAPFNEWEATVVCMNRGKPTSIDLPVGRPPLAVPCWQDADGESRSARSGTWTVHVPGRGGLVLPEAD